MFVRDKCKRSRVKHTYPVRRVLAVTLGHSQHLSIDRELSSNPCWRVHAQRAPARARASKSDAERLVLIWHYFFF